MSKKSSHEHINQTSVCLCLCKEMCITASIEGGIALKMGSWCKMGKNTYKRGIDWWKQTTKSVKGSLPGDRAVCPCQAVLEEDTDALNDCLLLCGKNT